MGAKGGQLEIGGVGELFDLVVEATVLVVIAVPKDQMAVFETSYHGFTYHQD